MEKLDHYSEMKMYYYLAYRDNRTFGDYLNFVKYSLLLKIVGKGF